MSVGYLADAFDLINVRDLDLIDQARRHCARLVLGVFTDDYAEEVSGQRPVMPLFERLALLECVRGVDEVVVHQGDHAFLRADLGDDVLLFAADDAAVRPTTAVAWLTPTRQSESQYLRSALGPRQREVVA